MAVALTTSTDGINRLPITGNNSANERKANAAKWTDSTATSVRPGILPGAGTWQLTYGSPTADTWYLSGGSAVLADGAGGALELTMGGTKSEAVTRPGAGTSRYDVIALEPVYTGSPSVSLVRYGGTAAASPVLSTATSQVTANGLIVGYYLVGNTGAPTITMLPKRTAPVGGVVRVYDAADLATLNPVDGDMAYQEDTDVFYGRVLGAWVPIGTVPHFRGLISAAITGSANIAVTSVEDTEAGWGGSTYTVKRAGIYRVFLRLQAPGAGVGSTNLTLLKGGAIVEYLGTVSAAAFGSINGMAELRFAVNDVLSVQSSVAFTPGTTTSVLTIDYVRP